MGAGGTDTAIETADVALMDDDLRRIPRFVRLSRKTGSVLWQNIIIALSIKGAGMGASLIVVFNDLRLLKAKYV